MKYKTYPIILLLLIVVIAYGGVRTLSNYNSQNTDKIINQMIEVGLTYKSNNEVLCYGRPSALDNNIKTSPAGKHYIDCSSFVGLCFRGVRFENSKYVNSTNSTNYSWTFDMPNVRWANEIAKYAYDNRFAFYPNDNFSNLKKGDLVFYKAPEPYNTFNKNAFLHIEHVAIYLGKDKFGNESVLNVTSKGTVPVIFSKFDTQAKKKIVLCCRIPFNKKH